MYHKNWIVKPLPDIAVRKHLSETVWVDDLLSIILAQRGINEFESARNFFRPSCEQLHQPALMKDMQKAVSRIACAIQNREKIMVYGDYDVDGTTSVAMVYSFLKTRSSHVDFYIPDRYTEGYGVSFKGIDTAKEKGCTLIICLDCGIKAVEKIRYAAAMGIDFIVCDHHNPGGELPPAFAILNPKRPNCEYPYKELSGCGIGFKLLQAFAEANKIPMDEVFQYIDLVAVSIASDIVPMDGENRILAALGLQKLNENPSTGLKSIMRVSRMESAETAPDEGKIKVQTDDIVFKIGPRINAAGRMKSGRQAVELLISDNEKEASRFSAEINDSNENRRNVDANITQQALEKLAENPETKHRKTTVLYDPSWHKGVIGIVASRLIETYYRPTVILTQSGDFANGSARSVEGFDLYAAIDTCSDLLENFGGHRYAAGLTLKKENIAEFSRRFEDTVAATIREEQLIPSVLIDAETGFAAITPKFLRILKQFQPFGPRNMHPVFLTRAVKDNGNAKLVGKNGEHLKLDVYSEKQPDLCFPAIGFQLAGHYNAIRSGKPFDICYTIDENTFRGKTTVQLYIKDIKICE
ncbi:MAG: single-stranded-DNA-specific exonuclease RecJ [Tannerella sp.]|jgi:single-stranded-DNA-specific exonuclease|nr:single-stranded-DNA-specific exonuclease RecJ [Tannerella sp.]